MSEKVCAESGREALAVRLERIEATIKERIEEWHGHLTNRGMTVQRFRFPDVQDEVEAPADLVGEQVLRALRAGATHVTVDKLDPPMYLLAPPPDMSDASIMAERPGQVFDFAKGTWVDRTPEGYDTNGGSVAGVGIRYLEAPGEAAVNASAPSGLRVKA